MGVGDSDAFMFGLETLLALAAELRARLHLQQHREGGGSSMGDGNGLSDVVQSYPNSDELSIAQILATTMRSGDSFPAGEARPEQSFSSDSKHFGSFVDTLAGTSDASQMAKLASASLEAAQLYPNASSPLASQGAKEPIDPLLLNSMADKYKAELPSSTQMGSDMPFSNLVFFGWPSDFPAPAVVDQLTRIFFDRCDYLRNLFQPSRFFEQLAHGPNSPHFPSSAVLHAIFAMAYALRPDMDPASMSLLEAHSDREPTNEESTMVSTKYHCERARHHIQRVSAKDKNLLSVCKAAIILTNIKYGFGDVFEAWIDSGIAVKLAVALSLNRGTQTSKRESDKGCAELFSGTVLPPAANWVEQEERRRVMFFAFVTWVYCWVASLSVADTNSAVTRPVVRPWAGRAASRSKISPSSCLSAPRTTLTTR